MADALSPRGKRRREEIKQHALSELNRLGFLKLRVRDITKAAGVADGLFYKYFRGINHITTDLTKDLLEEMVRETEAISMEQPPYDWIYKNHKVVADYFFANPGVLACSFGLVTGELTFNRIWMEAAHGWNMQTAIFLEQKAGFESHVAKRHGIVLGAVTEGIIYQSLIRKAKDLVAFARSPAAIAEVCAVMWYKSIFLQNPPAADQGKVAASLKSLDGANQ